MTIRKGCEKFFFKLEVACALAVIARSKPGYTVLQSRQKTVVKLSVSITMTLCLSVSLPVSVSVLSPLTPPPSLSLSVTLTLLVGFFVCDSGESSSLMLYLSEAFCLSISVSRKLVLSLTRSLFVCHFLTLSLSHCNYRFLWLKQNGKHQICICICNMRSY